MFPREKKWGEDGYPVYENRVPQIVIKKDINRITGKSNPSLTRSLATVNDPNLVLISLRDIHDATYTQDSAPNKVDYKNKYNPMTTDEIGKLHYSESNKGQKGYAFVIPREAGKLVFTKILYGHIN